MNMNNINYMTILPKRDLKKCVQKGLKKCDYTIYMDMNMNKRDLKTLKENALVSSIDMNERDLEKLSKSELIKMLLKQKKSKKVRNHEDLLDNDPFKDEVAQPVAQREPCKTH